MKRFWWFVLVAICIETVVLSVHSAPMGKAVTSILVLAFILYLAILAIRGWKKQTQIDFPATLKAKQIRARHWRLF